MEKIMTPQEKNATPKGEQGCGKKSPVVRKITVTEDAYRHLSEIVDKCNTESRYGKVDKQTVASHALLKLSDADISLLREKNKDFKAFLAHYLRIKKDDLTPNELLKVIHSEF